MRKNFVKLRDPIRNANCCLASLCLNVRKPREILRNSGTLGPSVAQAGARDALCPQAARANSARCRAVQRGTAAIPPPTGVPAALASRLQAKGCGVRAVGFAPYEGEEGEPESPCPALPSRLPTSRASGRPGGASLDRLGFKDPRSPPGKRPRAGRRPASRRGEVGPGGRAGVSHRLRAGKPPRKVLHQPPHVQSEGGRKSLQSPGLRLSPPPASAPPAARLPAPSLVQPRPPSRAAPRGAESSRAAARAASPV